MLWALRFNNRVDKLEGHHSKKNNTGFRKKWPENKGRTNWIFFQCYTKIGKGDRKALIPSVGIKGCHEGNSINCSSVSAEHRAESNSLNLQHGRLKLPGLDYEVIR